jgi:hypothetical protein
MIDDWCLMPTLEVFRLNHGIIFIEVIKR